ncbi:tRNA (cytosine-5-)-methyltransferase ncl1 [Paramarasmius palmivorus]|uniref:tRNA (Cytosine-5-)-methyltransferase ncl1 n=1 Tax=Paramarasmius palmivorus TaxID=297713 RepID=A0AAW0CI59_9AGAR
MTKKKRNGGQSRGKRKNDEYRTDLLEKSDMRNERFAAYYKAQNILPEDEWEPFLEAFRTPLPTTFRVAGSRLTATSLNKTITDVHVPSLSDVEFENQRIPPPVQLSWYPDGLAWQFNVPKKVLRKSPEFKKFHSFLVFETEVSPITESWTSPVQTAQLLEALHSQDTLTASSIPSGLLIANDSDYRRTHLLIHQSARLPSPAFMVTNLDASNYPSMKIPSSNGKLEQLLFDRILCDVPCSGDGTLRKNLGIWKTWQPNDGNGLHGYEVLQLRILQRAMKLLKPDGRIVYSTCSLNPVENEAVVAAALNANPDFHLVDVSASLPSLQRRPGLKTWRPTADKAVKTTYETYSAFVEADPQTAANTKLTEGHWPLQNVEELNLERCMRIYPHLQDSGGFFVAVLERKQKNAGTNSKREKRRVAESASGTPEPETKKPRLVEPLSSTPLEADIVPVTINEPEPSSSAATEVKEEESKGGVFKEMPYTFLSKDDQTLVACITTILRGSDSQLLEPKYSPVKKAQRPTKNSRRRQRRRCAAIGAQYRILGEGLPVVLPYVEPSRIIEASLGTLRTLVESYYPLLESFEESFHSVIVAREPGCHVVRVPPGELDGASLSHELVLPIWRSGVSLTLMIDKKAKNALSLRVFGKELPPSASGGKRKNDSENKKEEHPIVSIEGSPSPIDNDMDEEIPESAPAAEPEKIVVQGL